MKKQIRVKRVPEEEPGSRDGCYGFTDKCTDKWFNEKCDKIIEKDGGRNCFDDSFIYKKVEE